MTGLTRGSSMISTITSTSPPGARARYTHRGNLRDTRYGWLRLTPAYSLHLVRELAESAKASDGPLLDPFCGTGTTLLACTELGLDCDTTDLNPFLVWLANTKSRAYTTRDRRTAQSLGDAMILAARRGRSRTAWQPDLHNIERWWSPNTLSALARALRELTLATPPSAAADLCKIAFCRTLIETSNASFGHQSMSFRAIAAREPGAPGVAHSLESALASVIGAAAHPLPKTRRRALLGDARRLHEVLSPARYGGVVTSPPYPNRMSYIRELRPYMYWLGYLSDGRAAGELDWRLIGGTWGTATSRVGKWTAPAGCRLQDLPPLLDAIAAQSALLARYVEKYFFDMAVHIDGLRTVLSSGAPAHYVIGNSKFYDVLVPAERLLAELFQQANFEHVQITTLRKRTSKRELFEYLVSARAP